MDNGWSQTNQAQLIKAAHEIAKQLDMLRIALTKIELKLGPQNSASKS